MGKRFELSIPVGGMHCKSCGLLLADAISEIKGIREVSADFRKGMVTIRAETAGALEEAMKVITREGYTVVG